MLIKLLYVWGNILIQSILMEHKKSAIACSYKKIDVFTERQKSFLNIAHSQGTSYNAGNSKG